MPDILQIVAGPTLTVETTQVITVSGIRGPQGIPGTDGADGADGADGVNGSLVVKTWGPTDASFPATNYATLDLRNTHPVLDFPTGNYISARFHGIMPDNYVDENLEIALFVAMTSATSGNINFTARLENLSGQDLDADGFTGFPGITTAVSATSGVAVESAILVTGANLVGLAAGDPFRIEVARHTSARPNDTATGDAELLLVEMRIVP